MKRTFLSNQMRTLKLGAATLAIALMTVTAQGQEKTEHKNADVRMGQKALMDGDFKSAEKHLLKASSAEANDVDVQYLLGYSQFQNGQLSAAIKTFDKVIALDGKNVNAYYYKAKASHNTAVESGSKLSASLKEKFLKTAIEDYSKAIVITANDMKLYQNRAVAYRDLGILLGTDGTGNYNKAQATDAYNKAVADFEKVLTFDASRKDIQTELKKSKVYRDNLK